VVRVIFAKDNNLWNDKLLLEHIASFKDQKDFPEAADTIDFARLRSNERDEAKKSLHNILREFESGGCVIEFGPDQLLEIWKQTPDNPYKMIMASYFVAASGYAQEAALLLIDAMDKKNVCMPNSLDNKDQAGTTIIRSILRTRVLHVLDAMLQYTENYSQLVRILEEEIAGYQDWLRAWIGDLSETRTDGIMEKCKQDDILRDTWHHI
jgi:hypothetical protein